jgi:hypothetical protein
VDADTAVEVEVDAGGFAGTDGVVVVEVDAGGFAGTGVVVVGEVDAGGCAAVDAGVVVAVDAAGVEVVAMAELLEPQPLSMKDSRTEAARAATVNALAWNVMAAFSQGGMSHEERKRLSTNSGVRADSNQPFAVDSLNANHRPEAMHPEFRWGVGLPRMRGTRTQSGWLGTMS